MVKRGEGTNLFTIGPEIVFELALQIRLKAHSDFDFREMCAWIRRRRGHVGNRRSLGSRTEVLARDDNG